MPVRASAKWVMGVGLLAVSCANKKPDADKAAAAAAGSAKVAVSEGQGNAGAGAKFNPRLLRRFKTVSGRFPTPTGGPSEDQVTLGRMLYYEKRLSKAQDLSCNSCHDLAHYGVDGQVTSTGFQGQHGGRNSPTVYHAAGYFAQFWDGRAGTVEDQAKGPIGNPIEMAS